MKTDRGRAGRAPSQRQLKVGELVRHALAAMLTRGEINDPVLDGQAITVTQVSMSPDLRHATAYVMPLGGVGEAIKIEALNRHRQFVRGRMAKSLVLKFTPDVKFAADDTFAKSDHMTQLLKTDTVRRDVTGSGAEPD
ncbi:MAG: 30S ribosome-binding factor RbfA [Alphaproteobacteria bacterium]